MTLAAPTDAFNWVFSGMVRNELGGRYGYYFEIQRQGEKFRILSTLVDVNQKKVIFVDENTATLPNAASVNWQVGRAYLGMNAETHRWVLGVEAPHHKGFHFKLDALNFRERPANPLSDKLALSVLQTERLNGHVSLGPSREDEFVSARHTWFRQLKAHHQGAPHPMTQVFCQFNDGSGFYATHLLTPKALRGFMAGWRTASGEAVRMSQFVSIHQTAPQEWDLSATLPAFHVRFSNLLPPPTALSPLSAGVVEGKLSGFCTAERATA